MFSDLVRLTDRLSNLRIVIDHLPFDPPKDGNALRELGGRPSVYAKVSGVLRRIDGRVPTELSYYRQALDELWDVFGADRLVYGSNWPVSDKLAPYPAVLEIVTEYFSGQGESALEKYFWKNSAAAYRWVERG
jgi:predicted TIM-barrel fold metal-dependent hydrolase